MKMLKHSPKTDKDCTKVLQLGTGYKSFHYSQKQIIYSFDGGKSIIFCKKTSLGKYLTFTMLALIKQNTLFVQ